jgi:hypothetical protein
VPWCSTCQRFLSPPTVTPDGRCPTCGAPVDPGGAHPPGEGDNEPPAEEELPPVPLHLKVLGAALVVYLGYRFFQGIEWIVQRFS